MNKILDLAKINFDLNFTRNIYAKVTLNFQDEFEIRYCRISLRPNNTLWFQPPSLKEYGYAKCFIVKNHEDWKKLEQRVVEEFITLLKEKVESGDFSQSILDKIQRMHDEETITEQDLKEIDNHIDKKY